MSYDPTDYVRNPSKLVGKLKNGVFFGKWQDWIKSDRAPTANEIEEISHVKEYDQTVMKKDEYGDFVGERILPLGINDTLIVIDMQKDFLPWSKKTIQTVIVLE